MLPFAELQDDLFDFLNLMALIPIGIIAGFLNVTAGGGSLLALPFLIFLGLPATVANGTNRIAILLQNVSAVTGFHRYRVIPMEALMPTAIPAVLGSLLGAQLAVEIDELLFKRILAFVMVAVMAVTFFGKTRVQSDRTELSKRTKWLLVPVFFLIGIYGGFIQGGIGFLLITALTLTGYDLVKTNALKVLVVLVFTPFALAIFMLNGQVNYLYGVILACGNATGGWLATRVVVKKGHYFIRWLVMAAAVLFAIKLLIE